jgi:hypothetical protein
MSPAYTFDDEPATTEDTSNRSWMGGVGGKRHRRLSNSIDRVSGEGTVGSHNSLFEFESSVRGAGAAVRSAMLRATRRKATLTGEAGRDGSSDWESPLLMSLLLLLLLALLLPPL